MAKKDTVRKKLKRETVESIISVLLATIGIFFVLAALGAAGTVGTSVSSFFIRLLGIGYIVLPVGLWLLAYAVYRLPREPFPVVKTAAGTLAGVGILTLAGAISPNTGGVLGGFIMAFLASLFDIIGAAVIVGALTVISLLILLDTHLTLNPIREFFRLFERRKNSMTVRDGTDTETEGGEASGTKDDGDVDAATKTEEPEDGTQTPREAPGNESVGVAMYAGKSKIETSWRRFGKEYTSPPLSLLERDRGKPEVGDIKANANIIKRTLQNFGIEVEMDEVTIGPSVTRYALKPAEGVRLSKIVALQRDLELALAAHPLRIEAPIPGRSLVGIEVPNGTRSTVGLASILGSQSFSTGAPLTVALGKGVSGELRFGSLTKMPHLLIAGATGSGKSVTIHTIITSLLYRHSPEELSFIMIDPKRVELTLYNKIPHLRTPVLTDSKKAILALRWAAKEMDRRYDIFEAEAVRDIASYHRSIAPREKGKAEDTRLDPLPYIVIIIDELADIMTLYPRELEAAVVRLAQMSRATGIHLILSTQRPSVNVITGLIKANIPARVALQVASQVDSRTILDMSGAEKLLGSGDMLYLGAEMSKPERLQGAYISESEVKKVTRYLREEYKDFVPEEIISSSESGAAEVLDALNGSTLEDSEVDDILYESARAEVVRAGKASTSYLQRKLRVGYARAARIMDILEERGVIGPADGSKPRLVIGAPTPSETESAESEYNNREI